jgi:caffeoyl-CoA O-methyltransferase
MDINRENYELGLPCIEKAGVAHKIDFREGPALPVLDDLIAEVRNGQAARSVLLRLYRSSRS